MWRRWGKDSGVKTVSINPGSSFNTNGARNMTCGSCLMLCSCCCCLKNLEQVAATQVFAATHDDVRPFGCGASLSLWRSAQFDHRVLSIDPLNFLRSHQPTLTLTLSCTCYRLRRSREACTTRHARRTTPATSAATLTRPSNAGILQRPSLRASPATRATPARERHRCPATRRPRAATRLHERLGRRGSRFQCARLCEHSIVRPDKILI